MLQQYRRKVLFSDLNTRSVFLVAFTAVILICIEVIRIHRHCCRQRIFSLSFVAKLTPLFNEFNAGSAFRDGNSTDLFASTHRWSVRHAKLKDRTGGIFSAGDISIISDFNPASVAFPVYGVATAAPSRVTANKAKLITGLESHRITHRADIAYLFARARQ